jgi:hypothetical protein
MRSMIGATDSVGISGPCRYFRSVAPIGDQRPSPLHASSGHITEQPHDHGGAIAAERTGERLKRVEDTFKWRERRDEAHAHHAPQRPILKPKLRPCAEGDSGAACQPVGQEGKVGYVDERNAPPRDRGRSRAGEPGGMHLLPSEGPHPALSPPNAQGLADLAQYGRRYGRACGRLVRCTDRHFDRTDSIHPHREMSHAPESATTPASFAAASSTAIPHTNSRLSAMST